jgi:hypothetical protein
MGVVDFLHEICTRVRVVADQYGTVNATRGIEPQPQRAVGGDRRRRAEQVLRSLDDHGGGAVQLGDEPTRYRSVYSPW